jgi:hypothetical protein
LSGLRNIRARGRSCIHDIGASRNK